VIIGDQKEISRYIHRFSPGFYLDKSIAPTKVKHFTKLKSLGFSVISQCEEGFVYRDRSRYLHERVSKVAASKIEKFFCWGEEHASDIRSKLTDGIEIQIIGNARLDLLGPKFSGYWDEHVQEIRQKHGQYILVNTNFSRYNRLTSVTDVVTLLNMRGTLGGEVGKNYYSGLVSHLGSLFHHFLSAIEVLAREFPGYQIVVRPHPGESKEPYLEIQKKLSNVTVSWRGNAIPWILGSIGVVHNSCTTGVESALLEKPVISFMPLKNSRFDSFLPNELSIQAHSIEELKSKLREIKPNTRYKITELQQQTLSRYVSNISFDGQSASEALVYSLPDVAFCSKKSILTKICEIDVLLRQGFKLLKGREYNEMLKKTGSEKFPGATVAEIAMFLDASDRDFGVVVKKINGYDNVFKISKKQDHFA
jgi:surface carbohydrate biosynthesis protein